MSPMNGMELLAHCLETEPQLKSIVISGNVGEDELLHHPIRPDRFVRKPFQTTKLLKTVASLIGAGLGHPV